MIDRTAEIFGWLEITPETQPKLYLDRGAKRPAYSLLSNTLEADGLAVGLLRLDPSVRFFITPGMKSVKNVCTQQEWDCTPSIAHAVHDALCEAMDAERESNATNQ